MKLRKMFALSRAVGRNEIENVETLCSEALATDQRDLMALMALADAYWRNQRREDALTVALQALEVEPNADTTHFTPAKTVSRILAALAWLPFVRRLKELVSR